MIFFSFGRFNKKPSRKTTAEVVKLIKGMAKDGIKLVDLFYWTQGRHDTVAIVEAPDKNILMKANMKVSDIISTETILAVNTGKHTS